MPTREMIMLDDIGLVTGPDAYAEFTTLNAVVAAVGADPVTVIVNRTLTADTVTVPVNLVLMFFGDGEISVNPVQTVTGNGYIWAVAQTIFVGAGAFNLNTYPQNEAWWGNADDFTVGDGAGGAITIDVMETALLAADAAQNIIIGNNTVATDYLDLQVDGYVGVNPQVGGVSPFQTVVTNFATETLDPAGAITVRLPTADVPEGYKKAIINQSTNLITIESSYGVATVDTIYEGIIICEALQALPTAAAHWRVIRVYEEYSDTITMTWTGGETDTTTMRLSRVGAGGGDTVNFQLNSFGQTSVTSSGLATSGVGDVPASFRPTAPAEPLAGVRDNGAIGVDPGRLFVSGVGTLELSETIAGGGFAGGAGGNTGLHLYISTSWVI